MFGCTDHWVDKFKVVEAKVIEEKVASDHRPVLAVLEWVGKK